MPCPGCHKSIIPWEGKRKRSFQKCLGPWLPENILYNFPRNIQQPTKGLTCHFPRKMHQPTRTHQKSCSILGNLRIFYASIASFTQQRTLYSPSILSSSLSHHSDSSSILSLQLLIHHHLKTQQFPWHHQSLLPSLYWQTLTKYSISNDHPKTVLSPKNGLISPLSFWN